MATAPLALRVLDQTLAVCRLRPDGEIPSWAVGELVSVTRTAAELSVVCSEKGVPPAIPCERGWRCLCIAGTIELTTVGVLVALVVPLAAAGISIFVISTFDTDYLLVPGTELERACDVLRRQGHAVA